MSDENSAPESPDTAEQGSPEVTTPESESEAVEDDSDTFPREYVERVRRESNGYRDRAKLAETRVDELSREIFALKVKALDKLADAADIEYNADLIADDDALTAAVEDLIARRPHYAKPRKPTGSVGQGQRGGDATPTDFSALFH